MYSNFSNKIFAAFLFILIILLVTAVLISVPFSYYHFFVTKINNTGLYSIWGKILVGLNLLFVFLIFSMVFSLYGLVKHLCLKQRFWDKILFAFRIFQRQPNDVFIENAYRDKRGTYLCSYSDYQNLHNKSNKAYQRTLALIVLQIIFLIIIVFGFISFNTLSQLQPKEFPGSKLKLEQLNKY